MYKINSWYWAVDAGNRFSPCFHTTEGEFLMCGRFLSSPEKKELMFYLAKMPET